MGFFDLSDRYAGLDKFGDLLVLLKTKVPFEAFRAELKAVWRTPPRQRKSKAGRPPWDEVLMFKVLTLQQLYNLSDDQIEYQIRDRLSFMRFPGRGVKEPGARCQDGLGLPRKAGGGRNNEKTVRQIRCLLARQRLSGDGRADCRCLDRAGATPAQQAG